jgi:hypothetical protein
MASVTKTYSRYICRGEVVNNRAKDYGKEKVPFLGNLRPTMKSNGPFLDIVLRTGRSIECFLIENQTSRCNIYLPKVQGVPK